MTLYQHAVPVLRVASVEESLRWYADVLGFTPDPFPKDPPYSFAMLRRDGAEIMLRCVGKPQETRSSERLPDSEFAWSVYLRIVGTAILELAAAVEKKAPLRRGPERMPYGLVEFEICDRDGYRICLGGEAPSGADIRVREERRDGR